MARLGVSKKKKGPRATELSQLKKELQRVTEQLASRDRELAEASEREAATGDILRVIASSPNDLQPVLDVVAESTARLCEANDALIYRVDGSILRRVAHYGPVPMAEGMEIRRSRHNRSTAKPLSSMKQFMCMTCWMNGCVNDIRKPRGFRTWSAIGPC